jgi:outer membrane PBP1 activator LpoA protein
MPTEQQIRTGTVHARAYEADGQTLAAARERVFMPLCSAATRPTATMKPSGH